jgi:hypothetical protein
MLKKFVVAGVVIAALACEAQAAWRGGYRYRPYRATTNSGYSGSNYSGSSYSGSRGSSGRTSALDYPPSSQPYASRMHQWNKYPNQPFYLRGERRSLGILP